MEIALPPSWIENKQVSSTELGRYFNTNLPSELVFQLRRYSRDGYFEYEVTLETDYLKWEKSRRDVLLRTDIFHIDDPFGASHQGKYHLDSLYPKVRSKIPLSEAEISQVIEALPNDMSERYLRFKLQKINWEKLRKLVLAHSEQSQPKEKDWDYDTVEYKGLSASGSVIAFKGVPIGMPYQHRQTVRLFIDKQGALCTKDDFFDDYASIFEGSGYPNPDATLRRLVSAVRKELEPFLGAGCIVNTPNEGWFLKI